MRTYLSLFFFYSNPLFNPATLSFPTFSPPFHHSLQCFVEWLRKVGKGRERCIMIYIELLSRKISVQGYEGRMITKNQAFKTIARRSRSFAAETQDLGMTDWTGHDCNKGGEEIVWHRMEWNALLCNENARAWNMRIHRDDNICNTSQFANTYK